MTKLFMAYFLKKMPCAYTIAKYFLGGMKFLQIFGYL